MTRRTEILAAHGDPIVDAFGAETGSTAATSVRITRLGARG